MAFALLLFTMTYPVLNRSDFFDPTHMPVVKAIAKASTKTGVSFSYLMNNAKAESSLDPTARAKTSTASGLYQFTQKTWLQMVRDHGADVGLSDYASRIDANFNVSDARVRRDILALRHDPDISAVIAAKFTEMNAAQLEKSVGNQIDIGDTELYLAHVFGANGATKFIKNMENNADAVAANAFDVEARANPGIFYQNGKPQSFRQIYDRFAAKFNDTPAPPNNIADADLTQQQEDDMIAQVNNGYRPWVKRPAMGMQPNTTLGLFGTESSTPQIEDMMSDRTAYDFNNTRHSSSKDQTVSNTIVDDHLITPQPALLVMAQNYRHNQNARYNG